MMEVRFLNPDDAREWLRLRLEALRDDPTAFSASFEEYQSLSLDEVKKRLWSAQDAFVVGAFEEKALAGMAGFYREQGAKSRHKGRVWGVYVTPTKRRQGIARNLMLAVLKRTAEIPDLAQVLLSVTATQGAAISLYHSLGFETFGTEPRALKINDQFVDENYLVLRLR